MVFFSTRKSVCCQHDQKLYFSLQSAFFFLYFFLVFFSKISLKNIFVVVLSGEENHLGFEISWEIKVSQAAPQFCISSLQRSLLCILYLQLYSGEIAGEIKCHKLLLSFVSPVFRDLFFTGAQPRDWLW